MTQSCEYPDNTISFNTSLPTCLLASSSVSTTHEFTLSSLAPEKTLKYILKMLNEAVEKWSNELQNTFFRREQVNSFRFFRGALCFKINF